MQYGIPLIFVQQIKLIDMYYSFTRMRASITLIKQRMGPGGTGGEMAVSNGLLNDNCCILSDIVQVKAHTADYRSWQYPNFNGPITVREFYV